MEHNTAIVPLLPSPLVSVHHVVSPSISVLYPPQVNPYGLYGMEHGPHGMGHGVHGMGHGVHGMEHEVYGMAHGTHGMKHEV